jgi:UDP-glucose 4-epimerase
LAHFDLMADSSRLRERLDWRPEHDDLDDIVATALAWERKLRFCRGS